MDPGLRRDDGHFGSPRFGSDACPSPVIPAQAGTHWRTATRLRRCDRMAVYQRCAGTVGARHAGDCLPHRHQVASTRAHGVTRRIAVIATTFARMAGSYTHAPRIALAPRV